MLDVVVVDILHLSMLRISSLIAPIVIASLVGAKTMDNRLKSGLCNVQIAGNFLIGFGRDSRADYGRL